MESSFYSTSAFITYHPADTAFVASGDIPWQDRLSAAGTFYLRGGTSSWALYSTASGPYAGATSPLLSAGATHTDGVTGSLFYTTSSLVVHRLSDAASAAAGGMQSTTSSAYGNAYQPGEAAPRTFYSTASDPYAAWGSNAVTPQSMARGGRPGGIIIIGKKEPDTPVGDAVLPLLACILVYGAWKLRRMFRFSKK